MTPAVRIKPGVRLDPLTPAIARLIAALWSVAQRLNHDLTVTCGREGHVPDDIHSRGLALDVRANDLTPSQILHTYQLLHSDLGNIFTVIFETPATIPNGALMNIATVNPNASAIHFHVQLRKGLDDYPPVDEKPSDARNA